MVHVILPIRPHSKLKGLYLLEMIFSKACPACLEQWKRCNKDLSWRLKEMSTLLFHQWGKIFKFSRWSQLSTEFIFGFLIFLVARDFLWRFNYFTLSCLVNQTLTRTREQLLHVFFITERSVRFKNGITITSHHNRFSLQNRCPKLTVLDLTGTNIRKLNVEKLQVQISLLKRFCLVHLTKKGFLKRFLKVNCSLLQAGCPRLKELFLANLLLHSTPTSAEVVCNKLNVMMTNENEFNIWSNSSKEVLSGNFDWSCVKNYKQIFRLLV